MSPESEPNEPGAEAGTESDADGRSSPGEARLAPLYVKTLRVENFRGISRCALQLERGLTILVGRNNSGKSRILRALAIALGATPAERDDLTLSSSQPAVIDVILAPLVPDSEEEIFDTAVTRRLDTVQPIADDPPRERYAWRTTIRTSSEGAGVRIRHDILLFDQAAQEWVLPNNPTSAPFVNRSIVEAHLINTRRDLVDELARRGSPIRRILDDLEINASSRKILEKSLKDLSEEIVSSSASLVALKSSLDDLTLVVEAIGEPSLHPLPLRLEELARSVSVDLDTGHGSMPARFHGSGARSVASLQVQSVMYERRMGRDGPALRPHPVTLVEEPEAHLHPQAQFELSPLLSGIRGQVVVSTHSSHLVSAVEPECLRLLRPGGAAAEIIDLHPSDVSIHGAG